MLSSADIARTGEGDIAGALQRVTGLSVVGNGLVYVRGLGDRYSSSLLNGSPLPSPEPLKRVVPLDIFPTNVIASAVVQKSYSANYSGEFGGGVINLTTKALPEKTFFEDRRRASGQTLETTGRAWLHLLWQRCATGPASTAASRKACAELATGRPIGIDTLSPDKTFDERRAELSAITASLVNAPTTLAQRNRNIPANFSGPRPASAPRPISAAPGSA
ncbi:MAG: TonB-dependent receptor plug domain-containing protein [Sphingobium sp.]|nr:TonB-dependent receptor plug domain-containing protein [Sphingobium sp.]